MPEEMEEIPLVEDVEGSGQVAADESTEEAPEETTESPSERGESLKIAIERGIESLSKALNSALKNRQNVVMVRVNDEALQHLDMLVVAEITSSRSESAAFLINEGIRANAALFDKIRDITEQIALLREQLRESVSLNEPEEETDT